MSGRASLLLLAGLVGAALLSMAVYAARGRLADRDAASRGGSFLMGAGDFLMHWLMWWLRPLDRLALRLGLGPGFFNLAGLLMGALAGAAIAAGMLEWGGALILLGGIADVMDGRVARARGVASDYGKFIDATLDRFVEAFALLGLVYYLRPFPLGPLVAAAALAGSLLVSYARARGESVGVLCKEGLMQRAERLVLMALACLSDGAVAHALGWPRGESVLLVLGVIAAGTLVTAAQRTLWIAARLRERDGR
jgi:CDP-diacylglycerol--glycerol-3-phosphate 3-phosphatidyltransferase